MSISNFLCPCPYPDTDNGNASIRDAPNTFLCLWKPISNPKGPGWDLVTCRGSADDAPKAPPALDPVQGGEEEIHWTAVGTRQKFGKFLLSQGRILKSEEDGDLSMRISQASCLPAAFRPWLEGIFRKTECKRLNTTFLIILWEGTDPKGHWMWNATVPSPSPHKPPALLTWAPINPSWINPDVPKNAYSESPNPCCGFSPFPWESCSREFNYPSHH